MTGSAADGDKQFSVSLAVKAGEGAVIGYHGVADVTITDLDAACKALIARAEALDTDNFNADSAAALTTAIEAARNAADNGDVRGADVRAAMKALQAAMDNLSFAFPTEEGKTVTIEAEHGTLHDDHSNDRDQWGGNYPMEITDFEGASGGKIVNAINNGDAVSYRVKVERPGTYSVTLTYSSGSTSNAIKLSDDNGVFKAIDSVSAGHTNPSELKTVTFDLVAKKAGTTTLTVGTPGNADAPRLDKFDIMLAAPAVDKAELQKAVDDAAKLVEDDYTAETWAGFESALGAARDVLAAADATQDQVNDALSALTDAHAGLKKAEVKPDPGKPNPDKPNPDQPGNGEQGGNGNTGTKPSGNGEPSAKPSASSKKGLPKTGDVSLLGAAIAGTSGVAALGAAHVIASKRRRR